MNPQVLTYALVLNALVDVPIEGVMVEAMLCDAKKVESIVQPVRLKPHHLEAQRKWLVYYGSQLLACEKSFLEREEAFAEVAFPQNFAGCTAYSWFYMSSFPCEYQTLCMMEDYRDLMALYRVKPEHQFVELQVKGEPE